MDIKQIKKDIFKINDSQFEKTAIFLFRYQHQHNKIYRQSCNGLKIEAKDISSIDQIPFLPVELFKTNTVITGDDIPDKFFKSSGTTQAERSIHFIKEMQLYETSFTKCFQLFYGPHTTYCILALLPSYMQNKESSLIYMCNYLINKSQYNESGFYHNNISALIKQLHYNEKKKYTYFINWCNPLITTSCRTTSITNRTYNCNGNRGDEGAT